MGKSPKTVLVIGPTSPLGAAVISQCKKKDWIVITATSSRIKESLIAEMEELSAQFDFSILSEWEAFSVKIKESGKKVNFILYLDTVYHEEPFNMTKNLDTRAKEIMSINFQSPILAIQALSPLIKENSGRVVLHCGFPENELVPSTSLYTASKRALLAYLSVLKDNETSIDITCLYSNSCMEHSFGNPQKIRIGTSIKNSIFNGMTHKKHTITLLAKHGVPESRKSEDNLRDPIMEPGQIPNEITSTTPPLIGIILADQKGQFKQVMKDKGNVVALISQRDEYERLPIHFAAYKGQIDSISAILKVQKQMHSETDIFRWSSLHFATYGGCLRSTKRLLQENADPNQLSKAGYSGLHFLARLCPEDDPKIISTFESTIKKFLDSGADVNQRNSLWETPLHEACRSKSLAAVRFLVANEADVHRKTRSGDTPLYYGMQPGNSQIVKLLLAAGADPVSCFDIAPPKYVKKLEEYRETNRRPDPDFEIRDRTPIYVSCIEDLPQDAQKMFNNSKLSREVVEEHWHQFLMVLRFIFKKRFKVPPTEADIKKKSRRHPGVTRSNTTEIPSVPKAYSRSHSSKAEAKSEKKGKKRNLKLQRQATTTEIRFNVVRKKYGEHLSLDEVSDMLLSNGNPTKLFKVDQQIGKGGFGSVFVAKRLEDKKDVAIKKVSNISDKERWSNLDEIYLLQSLANRFIPQYYCSYVYRDEIWMTMEYLPGGPLQELVKLMRLEEKHICYIVRNLLLALDDLHDRKMIHRDLKSPNIMLGISGELYLIDFGLCVPESANKRGTVGSPYWMPPEMLKNDSHHTTASDIWSLGILCLEMALGKPPNYGSTLRAMFNVAIGDFPTLADKWSDGFRSFLSRILIMDPLQRATAKELLQDEWLNSAEKTRPMKLLFQRVFVQKSLQTMLV